MTQITTSGEVDTMAKSTRRGCRMGSEGGAGISLVCMRANGLMENFKDLEEKYIVMEVHITASFIIGIERAKGYIQS